uniref:Cytochrome b n=1 Tax=Raillietina tetragona TaxID=984823 RepID=A0A0U1Z480_9CEST|nr:cytochrome b [Raillietina tetragona]
MTLLSSVRRNLIDLPINYSLNYYWCSGFVLSAYIVMQIVSGVLLSFLYTANGVISFYVVSNLTNDSFYSWCVRYWHLWGVTLIFVLLFVHLGRALYYSSYSKKGAWNVGFLLYLLMMVEAFTGYVLPWHQMSYWAATVLTSIINSVPIIGEVLFMYIVGGFSVNNDTLVRMFSVHVCLGFVILGLILLHLFYLHAVGSNNPLCLLSFSDIIFFHCYFTVKDFMVFLGSIIIIFCCLFICPDLLLGVDSFLEANSMSTPVSIKPEWYFLAFFSMLRCVESKVGGIALILSFLFFLWIPTCNYSSAYFLSRQLVFWFIISVFFALTYFGSCHPEYPYLIVCRVFSVLLVAFMFIFKLFWTSSKIF